MPFTYCVKNNEVEVSLAFHSLVAATTPPMQPESKNNVPKSISKGPTNEIVKVVNGMKRHRLGGSDIFVSELGLLGSPAMDVVRLATMVLVARADLCYEFMERRGHFETRCQFD
jgi:hypothetical protein